MDSCHHQTRVDIKVGLLKFHSLQCIQRINPNITIVNEDCLLGQGILSWWKQGVRNAQENTWLQLGKHFMNGNLEVTTVFEPLLQDSDQMSELGSHYDRNVCPKSFSWSG